MTGSRAVTPDRALGRCLTSDDVANLAEGSEVWYAYDPGESATTYAWSSEEDRTGAVRRYVIGESITRVALALACANAHGASRFYRLRSDAARHLVASRGWTESQPAAIPSATSSISHAPQMALFSDR